MFNSSDPFRFFPYQLSDYLGDLDTDGLPRLAMHVPHIWGPCTMKFFVQTFTGKTITAHVNQTMTFDHVKEIIQNLEGIRKYDVRLSLAGKQLEDGWTLEGDGKCRSLVKFSCC